MPGAGTEGGGGCGEGRAGGEPAGSRRCGPVPSSQVLPAARRAAAQRSAAGTLGCLAKERCSRRAAQAGVSVSDTPGPGPGSACPRKAQGAAAWRVARALAPRGHVAHDLDVVSRFSIHFASNFIIVCSSNPARLPGR